MTNAKKLLALSAAAVLSMAVPFAALAADEQSQPAPRKAVKVVQTAGHDRWGKLAPDFAHYNDDILFGEVWSKNDVLSLHDRSIATISALMGSGMINSSFKGHVILAKKHGVTKDEMVALITQLAFYTGWPKAWAAFPYVEEVYGDGQE